MKKVAMKLTSTVSRDNANDKNDNAHGQVGEVSKTKNIASQLSFPSPHSVKGRVLGAHLRSESLTHEDCWLRLGSSRLAHHVLMLRCTGWPIHMTEEVVKTSDAGRPASIVVYSLTPEFIDAMGEHGRQCAADCARVEQERRAA